MKRAVFLALTLAGSVAHADDADTIPNDPLEVHAAGDEPDGYIAGGLVWGNSQGFQDRGAIVDAGKRLGRDRTPWFARGIFEAGAVARADEPGHGSFLEARAGLEGRDCGGGGMLCGSVGLDLGVQLGEFTHAIVAQDGSRTSYSERLDAFVAVPRFTIDAGGRIRFRAVVELPMQMRTADGVSATPTAALGGPTTSDGGDRQFGVGFAMSLAIAVGI